MFTREALKGAFASYLLGKEMLRQSIENTTDCNVLKELKDRYNKITEFVNNLDNFRFFEGEAAEDIDKKVDNLYYKLFEDFNVIIVDGYHNEPRGVVVINKSECRAYSSIRYCSNDYGFIFEFDDYYFYSDCKTLEGIEAVFDSDNVMFIYYTDYRLIDCYCNYFGDSNGAVFYRDINLTDNTDIFYDSHIYDFYECCANCGEWLDIDYAYYTSDGSFLCKDCIDDLNYHYCPCKNAYIKKEECDVFSCSYYYNHGCDLGAEIEEEWEEENIKSTDDVYSIVQKRRGYSSINYSRSPENVVFSTKKGIDFECFDDSIRRCLKGPVFAVEIESLFSSNNIKKYNSIDKLNDLVIDCDDGVDDTEAQFLVKNDCSLLENSNDENDFEFTPVNLCRIDDYAAVKHLYKRFFELFEDSGFYKTDSCGAHIHIDLNRYNDNESIKNSKHNNKLRFYNLVKAAYLIQNSLDFRVKGLFGRSFGAYRNRYNDSDFECFFDAVKMHGLENIYNEADKYLNKGSHDYFYNFTGGTFEFRIPAGIENYRELCDRLAAVKAVIDYVEDKEVYELKSGINNTVEELKNKYFFNYYI